jgi:hypothetical protein
MAPILSSWLQERQAASRGLLTRPPPRSIKSPELVTRRLMGHRESPWSRSAGTKPAAMTQNTDMALRLAQAPISLSAELAAANQPQPLPSLSPSVVRHLPSAAFRGEAPTGRLISFHERSHQARGKSPFSNGLVCRNNSEEASGNGKTETRSAVSSPRFDKPIRASRLGGGKTHGKS